MTKLKYAVALAAALFTTPLFAAEEDILPDSNDDISVYRTAGNWTIHQNMTRGSCFAVRADDTSAVQMGLTRDKKYGYIGVFVKGASVDKDVQAIAIAVNGRVYVGEAGAARHLSGGYEGGYVLADDKQLRMDLEKADEMVAFPDSPYVVTVNLKGARTAIYEARKCTDELQ